MIYLDTSALVKLVFDEPESADLEHWLLLNDARIATSIVGRIELLRVCRRAEADSATAATAATALLADLVLVPLTSAVADSAEHAGPPPMRSLDAVHLASALELGDALRGFLVYDKRLRDAAALAGLPVMSPGVR